MKAYIVRIGSNAANQPMCLYLLVGTVEVPGRRLPPPGMARVEVVARWAQQHPGVTVYTNQHLALRTATDCRKLGLSTDTE